MCWCILIPVLVGLISALLGYLLGKLLSKNNNNDDMFKAEINALKTDRDKHLSLNSSLNTDISGWKSKYLNLETEYNTLKNKPAAAVVTNNCDAEIAANAKLQATLDECNIKLQNATTELASENANKNKLQIALDQCNANANTYSSKLSTLETEINSLKMAATVVVADLPFDAELAKTVYGKKIVQDDLKIVEGIGPKIEELYHAAGIKTWKALSETSVEKSQAILDNGGERFQVHIPTTWAKQSLLAYEGKWQELKDWQDKLDGGKE